MVRRRRRACDCEPAKKGFERKLEKQSNLLLLDHLRLLELLHGEQVIGALHLDQTNLLRPHNERSECAHRRCVRLDRAETQTGTSPKAPRPTTATVWKACGERRRRRILVIEESG